MPQVAAVLGKNVSNPTTALCGLVHAERPCSLWEPNPPLVDSSLQRVYRRNRSDERYGNAAVSDADGLPGGYAAEVFREVLFEVTNTDVHVDTIESRVAS